MRVSRDQSPPLRACDAPLATAPVGRPVRGLSVALAGVAGLAWLTLTPASIADDSAAPSTTEAFDWDAAWEEAEERAREEQRLIEKARQVNEGELEFLSSRPAADAARMEKRIVLEPESLEDGWADMTQCHHNLDPAPAVQIVYNDERTRDLRITRRDGVAQARVDGPSV